MVLLTRMAGSAMGTSFVMVAGGNGDITKNSKLVSLEHGLQPEGYIFYSSLLFLCVEQSVTKMTTPHGYDQRPEWQPNWPICYTRCDKYLICRLIILVFVVSVYTFYDFQRLSNGIIDCVHLTTPVHNKTSREQYAAICVILLVMMVLCVALFVFMEELVGCCRRQITWMQDQRDDANSTDSQAAADEFLYMMA